MAKILESILMTIVALAFAIVALRKSGGNWMLGM
jgi:hypothetical protein